MEIMKELRNMASSSGVFSIHGKNAEWSNWTVRKAVKDGYKASGWVYRAVSMKAQQASSVPWVVMDKEGVIQWEHPIQSLLAKPHPSLTRKQFFSLLVSWLELAGTAYIKKVEDSAGIAELWPISPDRIAPIESVDTGSFISAYEIVDESGTKRVSQDFTPENTIQLKLADPANPLQGIGPLQAAARAVDLDNSQQDWNVSTMQNRGVVDGVFSFKRDLDSTQTNSILARIKEKFARNKREPLVVGSDATYTRLGLTSVEMDFLDSRKFNREEIFIIFGVPPQLAGTTDASTFNNFSTSLRIFWETSITDILDNLADQLNHALADQLDNGKYIIAPDLSNVKALRTSEDEKAKTAKTYFEMGVPVQTINERLDLGLTQYEMWDTPFGGRGQPKDSVPDAQRNEYKLIPFEQRNVEEEQAHRDEIAEGVVMQMFESLLNEQREDVFLALDNGSDPMQEVKKNASKWLQLMRASSRSIAQDFAGTVVVDQRGQKPVLNFRAHEGVDDLVEEYLEQEAIMLHDLSLLSEATTKAILDQVVHAQAENLTVEQLKQAIMDTGTFSSERALRLARTLTGTASSIGQLSGGIAAGAETKIWSTAPFGVRETHTNRHEEAVGINDRFSQQQSAVGPRYPLDPEIDPADRINCRCSLRFE